jgi:Leucine-rich repeat (LRR) protein
VTDAGLANIAQLSRLEELYLQGSKVTGAGLPALRNLKRLRILRLDVLPIRDEELKHVAHLENLEYLDLSQTQVTGDGLKYLAGLRRLRKLSLMSNSHFNGNGLSNLTVLFSKGTPENLGRELSLGWTSIGDDSLETLKTFTGLAKLDVHSTMLTTNGLIKLKQALPRTDVQHY